MRPNRREKGNVKSIGTLKAFIPFILKYRFWVFMTVLSLVAAAVSNLLIPLFAGRIFDLLASDKGDLAASTYFILAVFAVLFMALSGFGRVFYSQRLAFRVVTDLRHQVFSHLINLSRTFYDQNRSGEIMSRLSADVRDIGVIMSSTVSMAARQFLVFVGGLFMLFYTSVQLSWMVLVLIPIVILPMAFISKKMQAYAKQAADSFAEASNVANESIQNIVAVQSYSQETQIFDKYEDYNELHFRAHFKRILTYSLTVAYFISVVFGAIIFVFWNGAQMVFAGEMSQGDLIQFSFYAVFVGGAAQTFSELWGDLLRVAGAGERIVELLEAEEALELRDEGVKPVDGAPLLAFANVNFNYPLKSETQVLKDVSFELKDGERLALVGPSGAGKSTIIQLILRHYDATGEIKLNGQDIRELSLSDLRGHFAYVSQEPAIFATTIAENIAFGRPDASLSDIKDAAKAAFADEFIDRLEEGYDSLVGERGVLLSGGQKARIALARAFLSEAPILLLDEATAALDAESEAFIQKAVEVLVERKTVIAIAHRFATVKRSDRILVIDQGEVVAQGTHEQLMKTAPLYKKLSKLQFIDT